MTGTHPKVKMSEIDKLKLQVKSLKIVVASQKDEIARLKKELTKKEERIKDLGDFCEDLQQEVGSLEWGR